jgi:DNA processing protein
MISADLTALLRLYSIPGIGSGRMRNLITHFGSPQAALAAPLQKLMRIHSIERATAIKIKNEVDEAFVENQLTAIHKHKIKLVSYWDKEYPRRLKKIYDPPALLFMKGDYQPSDERAIGIVGTRMPTSYGRVITEQFCKQLVSYQLTIISGLARGVDTIAHQTVLNHGGRTIAVLGSGIDNIYPPENRKLAEKIADQGAVLSEYPMGTKPDAGNFPRRNRIISGLSLGILITEAGVKSGALITAFQALEQNREVFAIPGPINSARSIGTNKLIKEGAILVQDVSDIINELEGQIEKIERIDKREEMRLSGLEKEVFDLLSDEPRHVDYLAQKAQRSTPEILTVLLTLELMGVVKQLSGKCFIKFY